MDNLQQCFLPGDEWLYFKIYINEACVDRIILTIGRWLSESEYDIPYFYIRYSDPHFHLRYRFNLKSIGQPSYFVQEFLTLLKGLHMQKMIWNIQIDTYIRELERYKGIPIAETESHFCNESDFMYKYRSLKETYSLPATDYDVSFFTIALYMRLLEVSDDMAVNLFSYLSLTYKKEFGFNMYNSKSLNFLYRKEKDNIRIIFEMPDEKFAENLLSLTKEYRTTCQPFFDKVKLIKEKNQLYSYVASLLHMLNNRNLSPHSRLQELIIYDFIHRYYKSKRIRHKNEKR